MTRTHRRAWPATAALIFFGACSPEGNGNASDRSEPGAVSMIEGVSGPALPLGDAAAAGLSPEALSRVEPVMRAFVDDGRLPGVMTLVARGGEIVHWETVGMRDVESGDPLERDDIFRIFSMTKPVTSVAIMILVESGDVSLDDPVSKFIPAFGDVVVWQENGEPRPPEAPITIRHLLSHSGGLTYGIFADTPVDQAYLQSGLFQAASLEEYVAIVAGLPLVADPGTVWNYSVATDVLGRIVEIASGETFGEFLQSRIFGPLHMDDTAFWVPEEKRHRFTGRYALNDGALTLVDSPDDGDYSSPPPLESGGGGLASTASDYIRFAQMLLNEGELDGVRVLRPETVRAMRTNVLPDAATPIAIPGWFSPGYGFGLGFATVLDASATPEPDNFGLFRWGGLANTFFWIDPETEVIAMVWTQMDPFLIHGLDRRFQELVFQALEH